MRDPVSRKLNLGDLMIAVAASGMAMALWLPLRQTDYPVFPTLTRVYLLAMEPAPFLLAFAVAFLTMRLRRPRPPVRRLLRQPGLLACLVTVVDGLLRAVLLASNAAIRSAFPIGLNYVRAWSVYASGVVYAGNDVATVWAVLVLLRLWRPARDGFDRAGRVFGWFMIALWLVLSVVY